VVTQWGKAAETAVLMERQDRSGPIFSRNVGEKNRADLRARQPARREGTFSKPWETAGRKVMGLNASRGEAHACQTAGYFPKQTRGNPGTQSYGD